MAQAARHFSRLGGDMSAREPAIYPHSLAYLFAGSDVQRACGINTSRSNSESRARLKSMTGCCSRCCSFAGPPASRGATAWHTCKKLGPFDKCPLSLRPLKPQWVKTRLETMATQTAQIEPFASEALACDRGFHRNHLSSKNPHGGLCLPSLRVLRGGSFDHTLSIIAESSIVPWQVDSAYELL